MSIRSVRRILAGVDAELVLTVRWRGGDLDRLLDATHARLGESVVAILQADSWIVRPEVSFSVYGDRGSIDLLAWHQMTRTVLVVELKSEIASIEETFRRHDVKLRLVRGIALERFDWDAAVVARLLSFPSIEPSGGRSRTRPGFSAASIRLGTSLSVAGCARLPAHSPASCSCHQRARVVVCEGGRLGNASVTFGHARISPLVAANQGESRRRRTTVLVGK